MIKKIVSFSLFLFLVCTFIPAWANTPTVCVYEHSGVDLQRLKKSRQVAGFQQIERNVVYIGTLKGIGGFNLQLFGCVHYGATMTVLLGPSPKAQTVDRVFNLLPELLFSGTHVTLIKTALKRIPLNALSTPQHLADVAATAGVTDISVQLIDVGDSSVLVFSFYGG